MKNRYTTFTASSLEPERIKLCCKDAVENFKMDSTEDILKIKHKAFNFGMLCMLIFWMLVKLYGNL